MSRHFQSLPKAPPGPAQRAPRPFSEVRIALSHDTEDLVWFLRSVMDEIDGGRAEEDLVVRMACDLAGRDGGVALIVRGALGIEASLGIAFLRPALSHNYYLRAVWNVVAPEARAATGHAKSLLVAARVFADNMRRPLFIEEFAPTIDSPKVRLCGRHLTPAGAVFVHLPSAPLLSA